EVRSPGERAGAALMAERGGGETIARQRRAFKNEKRAVAAHFLDRRQNAGGRHRMARNFSSDAKARRGIRFCDQTQHGLFKMRKLLRRMVLSRDEMVRRDAQQDAPRLGVLGGGERRQKGKRDRGLI